MHSTHVDFIMGSMIKSQYSSYVILIEVPKSLHNSRFCLFKHTKISGRFMVSNRVAVAIPSRPFGKALRYSSIYLIYMSLEMPPESGIKSRACDKCLLFHLTACQNFPAPIMLPNHRYSLSLIKPAIFRRSM